MTELVHRTEVHITVATLAGQFEDVFGAHQKFQEVIDKAFLTLDIKPAPGDDWRLRYDGRVLSPDATIAEEKIPDGATLLLAPKEGGGGRQ